MSEDSRLHEWQCPPAAVPIERKLKWLNGCVDEGVAWLRTQRGFSDWREALDIISGKLIGPAPPQYRSKLNTNHLKRNVREVVGVLSKLRPLWGYSSDNPAFAKHAQLFNLLTRAWYLESSADVKIKEALQYAAATCTGWVRPIYSRDMGGTGEGSVKLLSYGAPCILPTQLPSSGNFQQAYAMTILDELPIYMAHAMFPLYQDKLKPTSSLYWYSNEIRKASRGNIWNRIFSFGRSTSDMSGISDLMIPIRYTYIIDLSLNTTEKTIPMGEWGTSWFYNVPALNSDLPTGTIDPATGSMATRKATETDARLYPYRRLIISSESCICYDGPSFDWHGRFPAIPFSTDHWPWEPIGFSMVRDGYDIQTAIQELERGTMDKERAKLDLPLAYDINSVSSREAKQFDPMQPRARVGYDASQVTKPFEVPIPPEVLRTDESTLKFIGMLIEAMDSQHAIKDVMALAKSRMAGDDMEKVLEATGPIIEDMSRSMEPPVREIADQVKYLMLQHLPPARMMQIVGEDNMTLQAFDYDPTSIVPSHLPGEDPGTEEEPKASPTDKIKRARIFASNLRFIITPRSLHELTQMSMKLGLVQLRKSGVQIDSQTIAEAWNVPNYGTIEGSTVREKWEKEQELNLMFAARMKELGMSLTEQGQMSPAAAGAGGKQTEGRPPSGHQAPALKQRANGSSVITESEGGGKPV